MPNLYIIGGCNGAGKTTASYTILPEMLKCNEFVNADSIAAGISPFNPVSAAFEAGRIMLTRIKSLIKEKVDFGFETTLSTRSYKPLILKAKDAGYTINLIFLWIRSPELALERIKLRVAAGGHDIPKAVVRRRYRRGLENLFKIFIPICDKWLIINNSSRDSRLIAEGNFDIVSTVYNDDIWKEVKKHE